MKLSALFLFVIGLAHAESISWWAMPLNRLRIRRISLDWLRQQ